jgi:hypothetical protein
MTYEHENYCFSLVEDPSLPNGYYIKSNLPTPQPGDVFIFCNLTQFYPGTKIFEGIEDLVFIDCNLNNCKVPDSAKVGDDCNVCETVYKVELDV